MTQANVDKAVNYNALPQLVSTTAGPSNDKSPASGSPLIKAAFDSQTRIKPTSDFTTHPPSVITMSSTEIGPFGYMCYPDDPSITNPYPPGEYDLAVNETITSSAYSVDASCSETHTSSDWEVCSDGNCASVYASIYDSGSSLESWTVSPNMAAAVTYYFRVRHANSAGDSEWSTIVSGTTGGAPVGGAGALYIFEGGTGQVQIAPSP